MWTYDPQGGLYVGGNDFGVVAPAPPPLPPEVLEVLVRFEHPAKVLSVAEFPGAAALDDAAVAAAYGTDVEALGAIRERVRLRARRAAEELLRDDGLVDAARRLPVPPGGTVVALGDSITDDYQSWAEILRHFVALVRGEDRLTIVNAGVSGDTTANALRRLFGVVELRPDLVITMLGTNDCQRHGPDLALLVALEESARNLVSIARWLADAGARCAWITPPPVLDEALARAVGERPFQVRDADVRAIARVVRELGEPVVDLHEVLGSPPGPDLLMPDGVHPALSGQVAIASAVLRAVAAHAAAAGSAPCQNQSGAGQP